MPSRRSITAAKRKEKEKKEGEKKIPKIEKPEDVGQNFDFCACPSHSVVKRDAGGKKGKLLCCKRIVNRIKAKLAFWQKVPGVNGLRIENLKN